MIPHIPTHCLLQYSSLEAFHHRHYDGEISLQQLMDHTDFGLGCFNALDGEIIASNGEAYHAHADGTVEVADKSTGVSGYYGCKFSPAVTLTIDKATNGSQLRHLITDRCRDGLEPFCALKLCGTFSHIGVRSIPKQSQPYPDIDSVVEMQTEFDVANIDATMLGFHFPSYAGGLTIEGFHFHFVSGDLNYGGHVMDFSIAAGTLEIDWIESYHVVLPDVVRKRGLVEAQT